MRPHNLIKAGIVAGLVLSWGSLITVTVVDIFTGWDAKRWEYFLPASGAVTLTAPFVSMFLQKQRIEEAARRASTSEAYRLALATVVETMSRDDNTGELPRVVGGGYPHGDDPTVRFKTKLHLIYNTVDDPTNGKQRH